MDGSCCWGCRYEINWDDVHACLVYAQTGIHPHPPPHNHTHTTPTSLNAILYSYDRCQTRLWRFTSRWRPSAAGLVRVQLSQAFRLVWQGRGSCGHLTHADIITDCTWLSAHTPADIHCTNPHIHAYKQPQGAWTSSPGRTTPPSSACTRRWSCPSCGRTWRSSTRRVGLFCCV